MSTPSPSFPSSRPPGPAPWSRALLAGSLTALGLCGHLSAQTYHSLASGNYSENFSTVASWTSPTTNSWSGNAVAGAATIVIPDATRMTAATTSFNSATSSSGGISRPAENIALLSTGATNNSSSAAIDLNLDFTGRTSGNLSFSAAENNNSTGDRQGTLKVYYSTDGAAWTEITGTNLPFTATNNVPGSASINVPIPAAVDNKPQVKLRFYYHNGPGGSGGSRPRITVDDVAVTSSPSGATDTTPPALTLLSPLNGAMNVDVSSNLVATFNESITVGTGDIVITKTSAPGEFVTIPVTSPQVVVSGNTLTINPTADLDHSTAYHVKIAAGAVKDSANNNFAGISDTTTWAFTTIPPDTTPPTFASFTPADGATDVIPPAKLSITFNEPVQTPFFSGPQIIVYKADGTPVAVFESYTFGVGVSVEGTVATLTLPTDTPLDYDASYYVEIDDGAFEDLSENPIVGFTGNTTWNFSTGTVPVLTNVPYTQDFATFTGSAPYPATLPALPLGWSVGGPDLSYDGDFGTGTNGGFRGNASVLGYQHTGNTGVLTETLTLRNGTGAEITNLIVSYKGRSNGPGSGRDPAFTVTLNGTVVPDLAYSTTSGDGVLRSASISSLSIPAGATFQLTWSSDGPNAPGSGNRRQIGISEVSVASGVAVFPPSLAAVTADYNTLTSTGVSVAGEITGDGGSAITQRGFVYSATSVNSTPQIGGTGVTSIIDGASTTGALTAGLGGLSPSTDYSVRAYATNAQGTSYSSTLVIHILPPPPTFVTSYSQPFDGFTGSIVTGTLPAGWTVLSEFGLNGYSGTWGPGSSSAGLLGNVSGPGVLGYQHTGGSGIVTKKLTLTNGTGTTLDQLYISYLGRVERNGEGRSPAYVVSVNGIETPALAYSTAGGVDQTVSTTLTGLGIAPGASFTVTWVSNRGTGTSASKQIGIANVLVATSAPAGYSTWNIANAGGQGPTLDYDGDGVKNGVEYFFGATGSTFTPNPQPVNGVISFPYAGALGATYKVWTSTNLTTWTDVTSSTTIEGGFLKYTLPAGTKVFVRLEVNVTP